MNIYSGYPVLQTSTVLFKQFTAVDTKEFLKSYLEPLGFFVYSSKFSDYYKLLLSFSQKHFYKCVLQNVFFNALTVG